VNDQVETPGVWYTRTIGYIVLTVIITLILGNAFQSFFFEKIIPGVSVGAGGAIGAVIAARRRKLLASKPETENDQ
jgi:membrane associated rhomboid family serine protease